MITNMKVTFAGYKYLGHYRQGWLELVLENSGSGVSIKIEDLFDVVTLFDVFDIDCENSTPFRLMEGKYCRIHIDDNTGKVVALQHLITDCKIWYVEPERK